MNTISPEYLKESDIDTALRELGFKEAFDCLEWKWHDLSILVGFWFGAVRKMHVQCRTERSFTDYERFVPVSGIKGWYAAEVYKIWREAYPNEIVPSNLMSGILYIEYQQVLQSLIPAKPSINVERPWMRTMITKLRKLVEEVALDPDVDFPMSMHFDQGQMMLDVEEHRLGVPASGTWLGCVTFYARDFLNATKRFDRDPVVLSYADDWLTIGKHAIRTTWKDTESI